MAADIGTLAGILVGKDYTMHTVYPTDEQRASPSFCKVYARRTPMIPFHNGQSNYRIQHADGTITTIQSPCIGCRKTKDVTS